MSLVPESLPQPPFLCRKWRLVSSADGESLSGQLCAGAEEEEAWDLQPRL